MPTAEEREQARKRPGTSPVMRQRWSDLLFLHWEFDAQDLASTLPSGLHLDTFQNKAYLGIVPFSMKRIRPCFCPPIPGLSWFLELNLRTYVHDEKGRPGVWFYSLDANQTIAVELGRRLFHLPYQHAQMSLQRQEGGLTFRSQRKEKNAESSIAKYPYQIQGELQTARAETLEFFLLERYLLFSTNKQGSLKIGQVHHHPYPFQQASCTSPSLLPFSWNGFPQPSEPPISQLYSPGVDVEIFPLRPI